MQSFFISSTFKDMQGERDALHKIVLPRLREKARAYGQNIQFIDLRWGISTEDMDSNDGASKIMEVCLDEIDHCKPYMIILLGERYGWMPDINLIHDALEKKQAAIECYPMSITEMEIQYGMLMNSGKLDHCIFCMRNSLPINDMPQELLDDMICQTEDEVCRLEKLKDHIRQTEGAHILEYSLTWNEEKQELTGYNSFAETLSNSLEELMCEEWGEAQKLGWQGYQQLDDRLLQDTLTSCFYGREQEVKDAIQKLKDTQVYILEAEGGSGKSAFVSVMAQELPNSHVIYCGNSSYCTTVEQLLQIMCWRFQLVPDAEAPENDCVEKWRSMWTSYAAAYQGDPVTIFIDAIDQLYGDDALFQSWYLPQQLSKKIKIVITTTGSIQVNPQALSGIRCVKETLAPPDIMDRALIIEEMFGAEHKEVSYEIQNAILNNPCSSNMLALSMMVRRLNMLGEKDFKEIHKLEKTMDGDTAIRTYLLQLIMDFSANINQLMDDYLVSVCEYIQAGIEGESNRIVLYLIACMENGLSREKLEQLQEYIWNDEGLSKNKAWSTFWNELKFARIKRFLGPLLIEKSDGKIDFTHRLLREGIRTNHATKYCAIVLLNFLHNDWLNDELKMENTFPLCRQLLKIAKEDGDDLLITVNNYMVPAIREAGNLKDSNMEFEAQRGEAAIETFIRSVLIDLSSRDGKNNLNIYCDAFRAAIADGQGPQHWLLWFFDRKIAQTLWDRGDSGKTMAIQIYLAMLNAYMRPEKQLEREAFNESESKALCWIFYHAMRLYRLLLNSIYNKRISGNAYDYTFKMIFEDGKGWFERHTEKYPKNYQVLQWTVGFYTDQAYIDAETFGGRKCMKKAEEALEHFLQMADLTDRDHRRWYVSRGFDMVELYMKMYSCAVLGGKKYLSFASEKMEKVQEVYEQIPEKERGLILEFRYHTLLAEIYGLTDRLLDGLKILWKCYRKIEESDQTFTDNIRGRYSNLIMSIVRFLLKYKSVTVDGRTKYQMAKELIQHESGYIRANINENFESQYNWAQMLRLRAYCKKEEGSEDYIKDLYEAKRYLRILVDEQKKSSSGIDLWRCNAKFTLSSLDNELKKENTMD